MIDFRKKVSTSRQSKIVNPIKLYEILDRKSITGPLRKSQNYILSEWFDNRKDDRDLIVKLHTGEGKTLIGLLVLQSIINMEEGPCLYVCPNKYLAQQVSKEAEKFGILYCQINELNQLPNEFLAGNKILITHAHKVFNGKSIFKTGIKSTKVGAIVMDDSHACINVIRDAFTITIDRLKMKEVYSELLTLFCEDLQEQGEGSYLDICSGEYDTFMKVPYWAWFDKRTDVLEILSKFKEYNDIKFSWELIRDRMFECECYISGKKIEIAPSNIMVDVFGTFSATKRRILMSATTQDDIFFVKGLGFTPDTVNNPLFYPDMRWSGEKMLIFPSLIDDNCDNDLIATNFAQVKTDKLGIVSIVPNTNGANYYKNLGANFPSNNEELIEAIENLNRGNFCSTVVFNNRYDGIDLPDESCRILIIDSMPFLNDFVDRYEEQCYPKSEIINKKLAQKIEQGLGRAVRGEKDYCAIIITGTDLVRFVMSVATKKYFSSQTKKQIDIGLKVANMAKEEVDESTPTLKPVSSLIRQMLNRDEGWKEFYIEEMNTLENDNNTSDNYKRYLIESEIENSFCNREYKKAAKEMQKFIDENVTDKLEKGWYLEKLARYTYHLSKKDSSKIQASAFKNNKNLLKPTEGIDYEKIRFINEDRINNIKKFLTEFKNREEFKLYIDDVINNLSFGVNYKKFESALQTVGELLGYISQRPDNVIRKGPDNLWCGEQNQYLLFECKNQVDENRGAISKKEAGQMNNHCGWFESNYGKSVKVTNFMIISTKELSYEADFTHEVNIISKNGLKKLKNNVKGFIREINPYDWNSLSNETLQGFLNVNKLNMDVFKESYSEKYYHKTS